MGTKYKWLSTLFIAFIMQFSFAQEKTITGIVTDASGPLPGVNVVVKGTTKGVSTGFDGKYAIKAKAGETLIYSFLGMNDVTRIVGNEGTINVKMQDNTQVLESVIVQGYRTVSRKTAVTSSASVNSKAIENRPNANAMNAVQGQLAGVNITATTGQPGARSNIIIRGLGTITGSSDPLYVIDGFPSNSDNFRSINPNDIESLDVLKDAAAVSEYGSRGSNGVIIIKTKRGNYGDQKTVFRYSTNYGIIELQEKRYSYANSQQLLRIEKNFGAGLGKTLTDSEISNFKTNTNWVDYFFRPSTSVNHNFSIENSGKKINSFTSAGYLDQEGILKSTNIKRFTIRNNINGKSDNEKFKYSVNSGFGYSKNNEATNLGTGAINRNYALGAYRSVPYLSPDDYQNSLQVFKLSATNDLLYTPLQLVDKLSKYDGFIEESRIDLATEMSYKIVKDFTARVRTSGQFLEGRFFQAEFPNSYNALLFSSTKGIPSTAGGDFNGFEDNNYRREFLFNNLWQLDYKKNIEKHTFNINASAEYNHSRLYINNSRQRGLDPKIFQPNTGAGYVPDVGTNDNYVPGISATNLRNDLISYFGSFDYDFNKKYGVVATIRRDGSSRFVGDKQFGNFWSVGARWNLEEESFMKSLKFINILKIRGSIGTVGNQRIVNGTIYAGISPPAFKDIYSSNNNPINTYNNEATYLLNLGYPALRWETTEQYNVGIDFELFNGRLRGVFDHYNKKTIDLFLNEPIAPITGDRILTKNSDASITNNGFELNLGYDIIKTDNTTLTIKGNGSINDNVIGGIKGIDGRILSTGVPILTNQNGGKINEPFIYRYIGVNKENGNLLFEDINGNPTEKPTAADRKAFGKSPLPRYQGGFGFDFDHKGFFMSTLFTFSQDVWRFDFDLENLYDPNGIGKFNVTDDLLNAWTPTNTNSNIPSLKATNLGADDESDRFLRDASYVRLRNIQIGYRIPKKFLNNSLFSDVSLTLQGENLINITKWQGFDPEGDRRFDQNQYPTPKIYTFGVDLKF
jgi:TonB-dependent starch-binding outer membrane protein SusC